MTRAGSKLVLRTSPAPGHYLCIKWDFASLPLVRPQLKTAVLAFNLSPGLSTRTQVQCRTNSDGVAPGRVQRLVAKTIYVERETALVVGSDNVLLVVLTDIANRQCKRAA